MNIFYLHKDYILFTGDCCNQMSCDKHVVKMILESANYYLHVIEYKMVQNGMIRQLMVEELKDGDIQIKIWTLYCTKQVG